MKYQINNFRAFSDTGEIQLAPITVLCGGNSSGKSSILKSILLIKQSTYNRPVLTSPDQVYPPVLLNGPYTRLGSWKDVVHQKNLDHAVSFKWNFQGEMSDSQAQSKGVRNFVFAPTPQSGAITVKDKKYHYVYSVNIASRAEQAIEVSTFVQNARIRDEVSGLTIEINQRDSKYNSADCSISSLSKLFDASPNPYVLRAPQNVRALINDLKKVADCPVNTGCLYYYLQGPLPVELSFYETSGWFQFFRTISAIVEQSRMNKFGRPPKHITQFREEVSKASQFENNRWISRDLFKEYPMLCNLVMAVEQQLTTKFKFASSFLDDYFKSVRYIGPLRQEPKRYYEFDDTGGIEIGSSGEYALQVLSLEKNNEIISSRVFDIDDNRITFEGGVKSTLLEALNYWLSKLGLPRVEPQPINYSLYGMLLNPDSGLDLSLPDVGFGVSQVLPIILESLRANPGETVLLEQPEIHLHPKVQTVLADFFLARANDGVFFIIESHSEYLVKRLCRRLAEQNDARTPRVSEIFFIDDTGFGESSCEKLKMNQYGEITNWPSGFFDTSEDLYWVNATMARRRADLIMKGIEQSGVSGEKN